MIRAGTKGHQVMDIMGVAQNFVELNRHNGSQWSATQADIAKFYDTVCPLAMARSLISHGIEAQDACFAARFRSGPAIDLTIGTATTRIGARTRDLLTGSTSPPPLAIVPLMDIWEGAPKLITLEALPLEPTAYLQLLQPNIAETADTHQKTPGVAPHQYATKPRIRRKVWLSWHGQTTSSRSPPVHTELW
jgi:hypothetical protein